MKTRFIVFLSLVVVCSLYAPQAHGQLFKRKAHTSATGSSEVKESRKVRNAEKKAEQQKEHDRLAYDKAKASDIKRREEMQSPRTKKMMKEDRKKAGTFNDRYHKSFFQRLFHPNG